VFVHTGINLDHPARASQKPRLPKLSDPSANSTRTWLNELKGRNIRVNVLSPGQVDTPDSQRLDKETREMFESLIPRRKMGRPEEIAAIALFLASDDSSYVNGVDLAVDGGFSAI
jgi:NAD(P)-dependent dehydrogenase (short-subunit alcohol dehydrogenase family)